MPGGMDGYYHPIGHTARSMGKPYTANGKDETGKVT
jgi:hypothetical protein